MTLYINWRPPIMPVSSASTVVAVCQTLLLLLLLRADDITIDVTNNVLQGAEKCGLRIGQLRTASRNNDIFLDPRALQKSQTRLVRASVHFLNVVIVICHSISHDLELQRAAELQGQSSQKL